MYYILFILLFCLFFVISINRRRIPPNLSERYIVSPIDGYVSGIHMVNLETGGEIYNEIIIKFNKLSSPYLYAPISGRYDIISNDIDSFIIEFKSYSEEKIRLYYGWSFFINSFNYPVLKKITLHSSEHFKTSETYGIFYFGNYVKLVISSKHLIVTAIGQNVIGGESILAIIN